MIAVSEPFLHCFLLNKSVWQRIKNKCFFTSRSKSEVFCTLREKRIHFLTPKWKKNRVFDWHQTSRSQNKLFFSSCIIYYYCTWSCFFNLSSVYNVYIHHEKIFNASRDFYKIRYYTKFCKVTNNYDYIYLYITIYITPNYQTYNFI